MRGEPKSCGSIPRGTGPFRHTILLPISGASRSDLPLRQSPRRDVSKGLHRNSDGSITCRHRADGSWGNRATRKRRSRQEKGVPSGVTLFAIQITRFTEPPVSPRASFLSETFRRVGCCDDQHEPVIAVIPGLSPVEARPKPFAALYDLLIRNSLVSPL